MKARFVNLPTCFIYRVAFQSRSCRSKLVLNTVLCCSPSLFGKTHPSSDAHHRTCWIDLVSTPKHRCSPTQIRRKEKPPIRGTAPFRSPRRELQDIDIFDFKLSAEEFLRSFMMPGWPWVSLAKVAVLVCNVLRVESRKHHDWN